MSPEQEHAIRLAKAVLWEEAKGKLRAIVKAEGSRTSDDRPVGKVLPFMRIERAVDKFISEFESEGFNE